MKKILYIPLLILTIIGTPSCQTGGMKNSLLPGIAGKAGEVVIIIEAEQWNGSIGDGFRDVLLEAVPGLPQREPMFNPVDVPHKAFTDLFKIHRNIVITNIGENIESEGFSVDYDVWATPQTVITLNAKSRDRFLEIFGQNSAKLMAILQKSERDRLMTNYKNYAEQAVMRKVEMVGGVSLVIPKGYTYDLDTNQFIWLSHETPDISQGIFVYSYPFTDDSTFTLNYLIAKRNEFLKQYVHGANPKTYMTTETQVVPSYNAYEWKGEYTAEIRGLWRLENGFMGGPFMSLTRVDKVNNRIVTVEGYVFAPKFDKRNYMRQVEAVVYSFTWPQPEETKKK